MPPSCVEDRPNKHHALDSQGRATVVLAQFSVYVPFAKSRPPAPQWL